MLGGGGVGVQLVLSDSHVGFISPGGLQDSLVGSATRILGGLLGALPRAFPKSWWAAGSWDFPWGSLGTYEKGVRIARIDGGSVCVGGPCRDPLSRQPLGRPPKEGTLEIARSLGCEGLKGELSAPTCSRFYGFRPSSSAKGTSGVRNFPASREGTLLQTRSRHASPRTS